MPTHILVNGLGLTHKSSTGFSKATIPDICKTPTPGGPVPMPYPNFAMSSTLTNGTTTVFAKGGKMIAVKGSRYTPTNGDEPGTVGGVKSNTFKQGTDWITYSFDVKMDGKNSCRDTDKKFHNDKNTVDLMGNTNPTPPATAFVPNVDCNQKVNKPEADKAVWSKCQCKQYCAKIKSLETERKKRAKDGKRLQRVKVNRTSYKAGVKAFAQQFAAATPEKQATMFAHKCAAEEQWDGGNNPTEGGSEAPFNADHSVDARFGGSTTSMANLKMLDRRVNCTVGGAMRAYKPMGEHKDLPIKAADSCNCPNGPADAK